jgi:hypothetical protein
MNLLAFYELTKIVVRKTLLGRKIFNYDRFEFLIKRMRGPCRS